ncbi:MAG: hypothetical protein LC796_15315 [Acidobacteria bacterium]|nr:hypothetical protein [Acidobacteriota bacterium]MCA1609282.1 hypothetical protein [Acidobacteriota bacterium]
MKLNPSLLAAGLLVSTFACHRAETPKVESKTETKSTNADGSRSTTTTETKQVGSTVAVTTETRAGGARGGKSESETVIGTVTDLGPGKSIVVLTGDGEKHSYDLGDKKTVASIDPRIAVGTKVRLDTTKDNDGRRSLTVVPVAER